MAEIINLRQARKRKVRGDKEIQADENRVKFGQPKIIRKLNEAKRAQDSARLDGHKREE